VWKIADEVRALGLNEYQPNRKGNDKQKLVQDLIAVGEQKLLSSSLVTFNKKLACMMAGNLDDMAGLTQDDEIPGMQLTIDFDEV
jgi:hypothetical protein